MRAPSPGVARRSPRLCADAPLFFIYNPLAERAGAHTRTTCKIACPYRRAVCLFPLARRTLAVFSFCLRRKSANERHGKRRRAAKKGKQAIKRTLEQVTTRAPMPDVTFRRSAASANDSSRRNGVCAFLRRRSRCRRDGGETVARRARSRAPAFVRASSITTPNHPSSLTTC